VRPDLRPTWRISEKGPWRLGPSDSLPIQGVLQQPEKKPADGGAGHVSLARESGVPGRHMGPQRELILNGAANRSRPVDTLRDR
jgi:hypothetical protein